MRTHRRLSTLHLQNWKIDQSRITSLLLVSSNNTALLSFFSLSTWEHDHLDSTFLSNLVTFPVGFLGKYYETKPVVKVPLVGRVETSNVLLPVSKLETVEEPSCLLTVGTILVLGFIELW